MYEIDTYECRFDAGPSVQAQFFEHPHGGLQVTAAHQKILPGAEVDEHAAEGEAIALVLVADLSCLGYRNEGASATNAMDDIVSRFAVLAERFQLDRGQLVWVELDSEGCYDMVYPAAPGGCEFGPIRSLSGKTAPRSRRAFEELFPVLGPAVLSRLPELSKSGADWPVRMLGKR